jgi:hypothetical protein
MFLEKAQQVHDLQIPPGVEPKIVTLPIITEEEMEDNKIVGKTIFVSRIPLSLRSLRTRLQGVGPEAYQISNKTFEDCHFIGPGVISLTGDIFVGGCSFEVPVGRPTINSILLLMQDRYLFGAIPFVDCGFNNCRFTNIAFAGTETMLNNLRNNTKELRPTPPSPTPDKGASPR